MTMDIVKVRRRRRRKVRELLLSSVVVVVVVSIRLLVCLLLVIEVRHAVSRIFFGNHDGIGKGEKEFCSLDAHFSSLYSSSSFHGCQGFERRGEEEEGEKTDQSPTRLSSWCRGPLTKNDNDDNGEREGTSLQLSSYVAFPSLFVSAAEVQIVRRNENFIEIRHQDDEEEPQQQQQQQEGGNTGFVEALMQLQRRLQEQLGHGSGVRTGIPHHHHHHHHPNQPQQQQHTTTTNTQFKLGQLMTSEEVTSSPPDSMQFQSDKPKQQQQQQRKKRGEGKEQAQQQQQGGRTGTTTTAKRNNKKISRRRLLYQLSLRHHYESVFAVRSQHALIQKRNSVDKTMLDPKKKKKNDNHENGAHVVAKSSQENHNFDEFSLENENKDENDRLEKLCALYNFPPPDPSSSSSTMSNTHDVVQGNNQETTKESSVELAYWSYKYCPHLSSITQFHLEPFSVSSSSSLFQSEQQQQQQQQHHYDYDDDITENNGDFYYYTFPQRQDEEDGDDDYEFTMTGRHTPTGVIMSKTMEHNLGRTHVSPTIPNYQDAIRKTWQYEYISNNNNNNNNDNYHGYQNQKNRDNTNQVEENHVNTKKKDRDSNDITRLEEEDDDDDAVEFGSNIAYYINGDKCVVTTFTSPPAAAAATTAMEPSKKGVVNNDDGTKFRNSNQSRKLERRVLTRMTKVVTVGTAAAPAAVDDDDDGDNKTNSDSGDDNNGGGCCPRDEQEKGIKTEVEKKKERRGGHETLQFFNNDDAIMLGVAKQERGTEKDKPNFRILKVSEPRPCRYVMHVCRECSSSNGSTNNDDTTGKNEGGVATVVEIVSESTREVEKEKVDSATRMNGKHGTNDESKTISGRGDSDTKLGKADLLSDQPSDTKQSTNGNSQSDNTSSSKRSSIRPKIDIEQLMNRYMHEGSADSALLEKTIDATTPLHRSFPPMPPSRIQSNLELIQSMFMHAYDSYMYHAFPASEIKPHSCQPGSFHLARLPALTLIDTLDTLVLMGNYTEFARSIERLRQLNQQMQNEFYKVYGTNGDKAGLRRGGLFAVNQNVSVFETNIRALGGLLSAHQLAMAYLKNRVVKDEVWDKEGNVRLGEVGVGTGTNGECSVTHGGQQEDGVVDGDQTCRPVNETCLADLGVEDELLDSCGMNVVENDFVATCMQPCKKVANSTSKTAGGRHSKLDVDPPEYWVYDGILLEFAHDLGLRLLPAYETETGIPYGTVNLLFGIPPKETTVASLAGAGTLTLEMELLSRYTGDRAFGESAKLASRALWMRRSKKGLLGKHIDVHRGRWTETISGIGSNSDSFYEYLIKHYILFPDDNDFWPMLVAAYAGVHGNSRLGEWYVDVDMNGGLQGMIRQVFESLMAFYPGMQVLLGELSPAARTLNSFFLVREFLGFLPERFHFGRWKVDHGGAASYHPLRPELFESCYFLHIATKGFTSGRNYGLGGSSKDVMTTGWLWAADFSLHTLHNLTRDRCGYAAVKHVSPTTTGSVASDLLHYGSSTHQQQKKHGMRLLDEMPSFFLSETLKYFWLAFDEQNIIHTDEERDWVFTTEAHPIHYVSSKMVEDVNVEGALSERKKEVPTHGFETKMQIMKTRLVSLLEEMISKKTESLDGAYQYNTTPFETTVEESFHLDREKWTEITMASDYGDDLQKVQDRLREKMQASEMERNEATNKVRNLMDSNRLRPYFDFTPSNDYLDIYDLELREGNLAHLIFQPMGARDSSKLFKSCPNHQDPALYWLHALNGGAMDYTDIFVSTMSDEVTPGGKTPDIRMKTALVTAGYYGTADTEEEDDGNVKRTCDLSDFIEVIESEVDDDDTPRGADDDLDDLSELHDRLAQRFDMGGTLGAFDIASYSDGGGFFVRHVNSGEVIELTFIASDSSENNASGSTDIVLVASKIPRAESKESGGNDGATAESLCGKPGVTWRSFSGNRQNKKHRSEVKKTTPRRNVVISDLDGHAFSCDVVIKRKSVFQSKGKSQSETDKSLLEETRVLAKFPCAPAMFGPSEISHLIETNGLSVEGEIFAPRELDEFGCGTAADKQDQSDSNSLMNKKGDQPGGNSQGIIQMVSRGDCSFMRKAAIQRRHNAEAMIVVNSDADQYFVMAGVADTGEIQDDDRKGPVSVLVTGDDGDEMVKLLHEHGTVLDGQTKEYGAVLAATVQLQPQPTKPWEGGKKDPASSRWRWPVVKTSAGEVQVYASTGWGIHAAKEGATDWQLFVLQHSHTVKSRQT